MCNLKTRYLNGRLITEKLSSEVSRIWSVRNCKSNLLEQVRMWFIRDKTFMGTVQF